jgi:hypothetical protein
MELLIERKFGPFYKKAKKAKKLTFCKVNSAIKLVNTRLIFGQVT